MSDDHARHLLAIGELVERTGVSEGTIRMWERRHAFPVPERLPSGHRRYHARDVESVLRVLREREAGLSLPAAIARVRESAAEAERSIFAAMRRRRPDLQAIKLRKPLLLALTHAIEDESCARAERPVLVGSFQQTRFYRQSQRRWREFARTAQVAVVFADFDGPSARAHEPLELPIDRAHPLAREWAVVCEAPGHAVCLAATEVVQARRRRDAAREFDVIWSVEPEVVHAAADISLELARQAAPELGERIATRFEVRAPGPPPDEQLRLAAAVVTRTLGQLG